MKLDNCFETNKTKCSICGKMFSGYGNNSWPLVGDVCCNECNVDVVIPVRLIIANKAKDDDSLDNENK